MSLDGFVRIFPHNLSISIYENGRLHVSNAVLLLLGTKVQLLINPITKEIALQSDPSGDIILKPDHGGGAHFYIGGQTARYILNTVGEKDSLNFKGKSEDNAVIFGKDDEK